MLSSRSFHTLKCFTGESCSDHPNASIAPLLGNISNCRLGISNLDLVSSILDLRHVCTLYAFFNSLDELTASPQGARTPIRPRLQDRALRIEKGPMSYMRVFCGWPTRNPSPLLRFALLIRACKHNSATAAYACASSDLSTTLCSRSVLRCREAFHSPPARSPHSAPAPLFGHLSTQPRTPDTSYSSIPYCRLRQLQLHVL